MNKRNTLLFWMLAAILLLSFSCYKPEKISGDEITLLQPVWLDYDTTRIWPGDFLPPGITPDSILILGSKISLPEGDSSFIYQSRDDIPFIFSMHLWHKGISTDVLLKKSLKRKVHYVFNPSEAKYNAVALKGEFNGWTPSRTPLTLTGGRWQTDLVVPEGNYQYLVVADGVDMLDPGCEAKISNNMGGFNSVMKAGNTERDSLPVLLSKSFSGRKISITVQNHPERVIVMWNNKVLDSDKVMIGDHSIQVKIPGETVRHHRSWIRVFASNRFGCGNDLLIPLFKGKVITQTSRLNRNDLQSAIMYNVFVDRFFNGDPSNDKHLPDSIVLKKANYYGGDLPGVIQKMEGGYFKDLGVSTLWLSPVVKNADGPYGFWKTPETKFSAYHGYWPVSFTEIDSHFGTSRDLKKLTEMAHKSGMNVLLDFVAHHVHQDHPYYKAHPDIATSLYLPDGSLNTERWDEYRLTTWFDVFLPTLDLAKPDVAGLVSDSTIWWLNEFQIDGFRHDAAKHIPLSFWRMLTAKIRKQVVYAENRPIYQIGETYGGIELIGSYLGSGLLDAQFDFNVFDAALGAFAGGQDFPQLSQRMAESMQFYGSHNLMGNITGNQDRGRFISYAGGDLKFNEDAKMAGWSREIGVGDKAGYNRLQMMMAFIMTIPGIPVIYYGDEFGMPGGNDPDSRRMMKFGKDLNDAEVRNIDITRKLTSIRRNNMALLYGDFVLIQSENHQLIYARNWFGSTVVVAYNNSKEKQLMKFEIPSFAAGKEFKAAFNHPLQQNKSLITLTLPPDSFEILISQ
jgi:cyclomaltodextrinase / maltogenic alpha-amylase / neopullulanase